MSIRNQLTVAQLEHLLAIKRADMKLRPAQTPRLDPVAAVPDLALADDKARRDQERAAKLEANAEAQREADRAHWAKWWADRARELHGFPPRVIVDLAKYEQAIHADRVIPWARLTLAMRLGGLIGLYGTWGAGKTTTFGAMARWYMPEFRTRAVYTTAEECFSDFCRKTQGYNARMTAGAWLAQLNTRAGLLGLDELDKVPGIGTDTHTGKQIASWLDAIARERHGMMNRPLVLLGNFDDAQWETLIPPAVHSRFKTNGLPCRYGGPDLRTPTRSNP